MSKSRVNPVVDGVATGSSPQQSLSEHDGSRVQSNAALEATSAFAKYENYSALAQAVAGGKNSAIVLVKAEWLQELLEAKQSIPPRQEVPPEHVWDGPLDDNVLIITLSYPWCTEEHPDPDRIVLRDLCRFIAYLHESRRFGDDNPTIRESNIDDRQILIFWDFISLYQNFPKGVERTKEQNESFKNGLDFANVLYAHKETWVLFGTSEDYTAGRGLLYMNRGWPYFEFSVAQLVKDADRTLDLVLALDHIEKLRNDSDTKNRAIYWLHRACRKKRQIIAQPDKFDKEVEKKYIYAKSDTDVLKKKYRETFDIAVPHTQSFELRDLPDVSSASWADFLDNTLKLCSKNLMHVDLRDNEDIESTLLPFGELKACRVLALRNCIGMHGSLEPLRNLTRLERLLLAGCPLFQGDLTVLSNHCHLIEVSFECCFGLRGNLEPLAGSTNSLQILNVEDTFLEGFEAFETKGIMGRGGRGSDASTTPLWTAAQFGHSKVIRGLLEHGKTKLRVDRIEPQYDNEETPRTPLYEAVLHGHDNAVVLLLAELDLSEAGDQFGDMLLHAMTEYDISGKESYLGVVRALVKAAVQKGAVGLVQNTTNMAMAMEDRECQESAEENAVIKLQYNFEILNAVFREIDVDRINPENGFAPLCEATFKGRSDLAEGLLKLKANPNLVHEESGRTALLFAIQNNQIDIVKLLLEGNANPNFIHEESGMTAKEIAQQVMTDEIYAKLLQLFDSI